MKRFTLITLITILTTSFAKAQLNGDGYYRILNNGTHRYVTITDDIVGEVNMSNTQVDLSNITTWRGFDYVKSSPASIFYIRSVGSQYDLAAQGTSIYKLAGGKTYIDITDRNGAYLLSVTYKGYSGSLHDSNDDSDEGYVLRTGETPNKYWLLQQVNTSDNYLGLQPTVQANDGWYGTIYADFPFKVMSEGIKVYYVDGVHEGQFQLNEITDEIKPSATPLVFKCSSNDPANNMIMPVYASTTAPTGNKMGGTFFASTINYHEKYVKYDSNTMRVLGVDGDKNLIFTTADASYLKKKKYIPMNTCWLNVPTGLTGDFKLVTRSEFTGISSIEASTQKHAVKGTFTLSGVQVDDNKALRPGVYIKDGKKIVIK